MSEPRSKLQPGKEPVSVSAWRMVNLFSSLSNIFRIPMGSALPDSITLTVWSVNAIKFKNANRMFQILCRFRYQHKKTLIIVLKIFDFIFMTWPKDTKLCLVKPTYRSSKNEETIVNVKMFFWRIFCFKMYFVFTLKKLL